MCIRDRYNPLLYKRQHVQSASSTPCWFCPHRKKWRSEKKWCWNIWLFACLKGDGICFCEKNKKKCYLEKTSVLRSSLARKGSLVGSLMWPWGVSGQFRILLGCNAIRQILICRSLAISQVLIFISSTGWAQMLSCKFLTSQNISLKQSFIRFLTSLVYGNMIAL